MINKTKIKIYCKYDGNIDSWTRSIFKKDKLAISDEDWFLIDSFLQDLSIVNKGLTSLHYNDTLNFKIKENCDTDETMKALKALVSKEKERKKNKARKVQNWIIKN